MKLASKMFSSVIEINKGEAFSIIIENQRLFRNYISDLYSQISNCDGEIVLSENNNTIPIKNSIDILDFFTPFDINTKALITSINNYLQVKAVNEQFYSKTTKLLQDIEQFIDDLCFDLPFSVECKRNEIANIIKSVQVQIANDYDSDIEAVVDYMSLQSDFCKHKLFVFINFRSFFNDEEMHLFIRTVQLKQFSVLLIESSERAKIKGMNQLIIDSDLCEI